MKKNPFVARILRDELNAFIHEYGWQRFNRKLESVFFHEYQLLYEHLRELARYEE
jgi:hypothetical protein